jgi:hypothetical protein
VGPVAAVPELLGRPLAARLVEVADHDLGPRGGEHARDRLAEPGRGAGHQRDLAVERQQLTDGLVHRADCRRAEEGRHLLPAHLSSCHA